MKFLYFQDFHISGKNSRNRLGDYFQDCLIKLDEILSLASKHKCDCILDGGDFFETDKPSYKVLDSIADKIETAKIPLYSLFGNHSMSYGHVTNSQNTGLAHLQKRSKYFKSLIEDFPFPDETQAEGWEIKPIEYEFNIENKIKDGISFDKGSYWKIAIIHALVTPGKFFDNVPHIPVQNLKTNADLVLLAHYHMPFNKVIKDTTFLNIGCCGRLNINEAKIEPSVLLLDTEKRNYKIIKLKSAKKPEEIFDLSKYEELKENEKSIEEFIASLNSSTWQVSDLNSQIEIIGKEQNIEPQVIKYIKNKMKEIKDV